MRQRQNTLLLIWYETVRSLSTFMNHCVTYHGAVINPWGDYLSVHYSGYFQYQASNR